MDDTGKRQEQLAAMERCRQQGEKRYDDMYAVHTFRDANDCYRDAKEFYWEAIGIAKDLGLHDIQATMENRLAHIQAVFRSQFVQ